MGKSASFTQVGSACGESTQPNPGALREDRAPAKSREVCAPCVEKQSTSGLVSPSDKVKTPASCIGKKAPSVAEEQIEPVRLYVPKACRSDPKPSKMRQRARLSHEYGKKLEKLRQTRRRETLKQAFGAWKSQTEFKLQSGSEQKSNARFVPGIEFMTLIPLLIKDPVTADYVENFAIAAYHIMKAKTMGDVLMTMLSFAKMMMKGCVMHEIRDKISGFLRHIGTDDLSELSDDSFEVTDDFSLQDGFEDTLTVSKEKLDSWPRIRKSPLWKKVNRALVYVTALSLYDERVVSGKKVMKVADEYYHSKGMMAMDFTHAVLDLALFVVEKGYQIY